MSRPIAFSVLSLYNLGMWTEHGIEILRECEAKIRGVVAEAAADGAYQAVMQLAKLARNIAAVTASVDSAGTDSVTGGATECVSETTPVPLPQITSGHVDQASHQPERCRTGELRRKSKRLRSTYPKFICVKDDLVKIGWSKKEKSEYRHKAPRYVVDCLRDRIQSVGGRGKLVTTDDLFPLNNAKDGVEIPSYQSYLCLAWFRKERLIHQEGRQGYRARDPKSFGAAVEECWMNLSSET